MAAVVTNLTRVEDDPASWKTYYLRVHADGQTFFKIGTCTGTVKARYKKEPSTTKIEIVELWIHRSQSAALAHEAKLFKIYKGNRPYIGRCGPFRFGGNTETFSHDAMNGEPPPPSFIVRMYSRNGLPVHTTGYPQRNPRLPYANLHGQVRYMDHLHGPEDVGEGPYLQIPKLSSRDRVVIATLEFLKDLLDPRTPAQRWFPRRTAAEALADPIFVRRWSDYEVMRFEGHGFKVDQWTEWG